MKTNALYGFGIGLAGAVIVLLQFALGYHNDPAKLATGQVIGYLGLLPTIALLVLGIRKRRDATPAEKGFSYGQGLGNGVVIGVVAGVFGLIFQLLYGYVINPGFHETLFNFQVDAIAAAGHAAPPEEFLRFMTGPLFFAGMGFMASVFACTIISLLAAALLRRPASLNPTGPA